MSKLADGAWWRDVLDRAFRQALQVLLPVLALAATTGRVDVKAGVAVLVVAVTQAAVVVFRALTEIRASSGAPLALQVLDRSVAAAAGAVLAILTADGFDLLALDVRAAALSVAFTVLTALGMGYLSPAKSMDYDLAA